MSENVDTANDMVNIAAQTCTGDIRDFLLDRLKHDKSPIPWNMLGEEKQREAIEQTTAAARRLVEKVARICLAQGASSIDVAVDQVVIKDGVKAVVTCASTSSNRNLLGAAQGQVVQLVFMDTSPLHGERKAAIPMKDQPPLPIEPEHDPETGEVPPADDEKARYAKPPKKKGKDNEEGA